MRLVLVAIVVSVVGAACGGSTPQVRYYQLAGSTAPAAKPTGDKVLVVEALTSDGAYDDERIVYRNNPYRLDYYNYHRWVAAPGALVGGYLQQALGRTGDFKAVLREQTADTSLVLGGRITAIEEIDRDPKHWVGRIALELTLMDPMTGEIVWAQPFEETEPLPVQNPEGLARAISTALDRIAKRAAPAIVEHATSKQARK
ncbi:MAG TPA: ABC-type transport auxiliary lipoprotein family protein [Kofleriaceae bacterium]|nr:ABC-type transport auxiliary lipoprotein family protein [Kofleriaceae bacterium]